MWWPPIFLNFSQLKLGIFLNFWWPPRPLLGTFPKFWRFLILKAPLKTIFLKEIIKLCFISAFCRHVHQILFTVSWYHIQEKKYKKDSFKLINSMFWKVTYSIISLTFDHIRKAIQKYNWSNFGHFPNKGMFYFLIYKFHIKPNKLLQLSRIRISTQSKTRLFRCKAATLWPFSVKPIEYGLHFIIKLLQCKLEYLSSEEFDHSFLFSCMW